MSHFMQVDVEMDLVLILAEWILFLTFLSIIFRIPNNCMNQQVFVESFFYGILKTSSFLLNS